MLQYLELKLASILRGQQADVADLDAKVKAIANLKLVDAMKIATEDVGNARTMNMVLAGALSTPCPFTVEQWRQAMAEMLTGPKAKLLDINRKAFDLGRAAVS